MSTFTPGPAVGDRPRKRVARAAERSPPTPALAAYEELAPHYDALTAGYDHDVWLVALEQAALRHGLRGRRLLDVACGTGKSFLPLLRRGYEATACDLSPAMVRIARRRARGRARLFVADMRALPPIGRFDLVTCLDDALNYLLSDADLAAALGAMAGRLSAGGLLVFDVNTLATYRTAFAGRIERSCGELDFDWAGCGSADTRPGSVVAATIDVRTSSGVHVSHSRHVQRHHTDAAIESALDLAGLRCVARYGQLPGARLEQPPDQLRHTKVVWLARRAVASHASEREEVTA
jgi:SAM-dependent methyltransferase